jgi:hypothetical protein
VCEAITSRSGAAQRLPTRVESLARAQGSGDVFILSTPRMAKSLDTLCRLGETRTDLVGLAPATSFAHQPSILSSYYRWGRPMASDEHD